jgi:hypothetical protein
MKLTSQSYNHANKLKRNLKKCLQRAPENLQTFERSESNLYFDSSFLFLLICRYNCNAIWGSRGRFKKEGPKTIGQDKTIILYTCKVWVGTGG